MHFASLVALLGALGFAVSAFVEHAGHHIDWVVWVVASVWGALTGMILQKEGPF